jgi:hypothetical protein
VNSGYDSIYRGLVARLPQYDLEEAAGRLGLEYVSGAVRVRFLSREYAITRQGVDPLDGHPVNVNIRNVLLYYLYSTGRGDPEDSYILFEAIPRTITGLNSPGHVISAPLARHFGNDRVRFAEAAARLGGTLREATVHEHVWRFTVLPKIRLQAVFHDADDEFPATVQIMLDRAALRFLEFECLAFMTGCLVRALIKTSQYRDVAGWDR